MLHLLSLFPQYLSIGLIRFYQKFLSPRKGFCCAYRKHTGGRSCSGFALVAVRRYGVSALWRSFPKRLDECKIAAIRLSEDEQQKTKPCEYCEESLDTCSCVKDCSDSISCNGPGIPGADSCGESCSCGDSCSCSGCDLSVKHKIGLRNFSFSPFFILIWLHKISNKRRGR